MAHLGPVCRTPRLFAWQAWRLATSTFTLCGRRGTWRHRLSLCVASMALGNIDRTPRLFVWQAWRLAFCMAGVGFGDINRHFAWQAWRLGTSAFTSCGRRSAWRHRHAFCVSGVAVGWLCWRLVPVCRRGRRGCHVEGVALGDIDLHFVWHAWQLGT